MLALHDCWSKDEVDKLVTGFKVPKDAIHELISLTKSALTKFKNVIVSAKREVQDEKQQKEDAKKKKGKLGKTKTSTSGMPLHDTGASLATSILVFAMATWNSETFDSKAPVVVSLSKEHALMKPDTALRKGVDMFASKFDQSKKDKMLKAAAGQPVVADLRAQRLLDSEVQVEVNKFIEGLVGACVVDEARVSKTVASILQPAAFGIEKDYSAAASEKEYLAAFRLTVRGTRSVVMTHGVGLSKFFRTRSSATQAQPWRKLCHFFHTMKDDEVKAYIKDHKTFFATIAAGDLLYIPAGFVVSEVVGSTSDIAGYCRSPSRGNFLR